MGTLCPELAKEGHLSLSLQKSPSSFIKMVDNVETTTPTIEEVAAPVADNGEAAAVTEEVKTSENGANGAAEKTEEKEETTEEVTEETTEETTEESLRKPQRGKLTLLA